MLTTRSITIAILGGLLLVAPGAGIAATTSATVRGQVIKPLVLAAKQGIEFGTVIMTNVTAPVPVTISQTGVITCGSGLSCSGTTKQAIFNVQGSNNQVVRITAGAAQISNGTTSLTFTPSAPASLTLTNSGAPGIDFSVGGTFSITPTTTEGAYTGTMTVTVDYN